MNLKMIFLVIVFFIGVSYYYKYRSDKRKINSQLYLSPTEELGRKICDDYVVAEVKSKITKDVTLPKKIQIKSKIKPIVKSKDNLFRNKILNIVAGKYIITDKYTLDYLIDRLQEIDIDTKDIDYYLLYCSRHLFIILKDPMKKILIGQYILKHTDKNEDVYSIYDYILQIANDAGLHEDLRMNAVDILLHSNNNKYVTQANTILESIRRIDDIRRNNQILPPIEDIQLQQGLINDVHLQRLSNVLQVKKDIPRTVYEDSQNVHNTGINESVLKLASELVKENDPSPIILYFDYNLIQSFEPEKRAIIEKSLHRIMTDPSEFKYNTNLYIIFQSLLNYIEKLQEPVKTSVNNRLIEELIEMSGMCVTGHLSRLLNVIQGFEEVPNKFKLKISIDDEIYATMKNHYDKILADNEELMDDLMTEDKILLSQRLKQESNLILQTLHGNYPPDRKTDVRQGVLKSLNKYLGTNFQINGEIIS